MPSPADVATGLYRAFAEADSQALWSLLTDDFVGTVSAGMPLGVGGKHLGPAAMIKGVWQRLATIYDVHVDPAEYLPVDSERVVVVGRYWGLGRRGDTQVDAAFAHIITTRSDQICALVQITDTLGWGT
jgi:2-(1,2-epoxy-1,2-dihydrophenyl)acetyl-CoA isomerase